MVPALNPTGQDSPRTGVPAYLRGEILTPLPGDVPSLCDPLTGARRGGDVAGRSMRQNRDLRRPDNGCGCRHVPLAFAGPEPVEVAYDEAVALYDEVNEMPRA